ncbi:hypothetical protein F5Y16DRAFT_155805 [Xylariaceae sp. FL0255]|nr:hypothetical protein F5Y16DRAFT_155805 [Xylariaceae sp. FL0255]
MTSSLLVIIYFVVIRCVCRQILSMQPHFFPRIGNLLEVLVCFISSPPFFVSIIRLFLPSRQASDILLFAHGKAHISTCIQCCLFMSEQSVQVVNIRF